MQTELPPLIALVGATAVGKTAFSLDLARALGGEIISADSRQIYRGMTIGTAKPTPAELARAPHHLIDIADPDDDFSLAMYQAAAAAAIADVIGRGNIPLLVGGTGQYLAAVLEGWQIPQVAPQEELRASLRAEAERDGAPALHRRLAEVDPEAAAGIDAANVRRVIRALEVFRVTGQPISRLQTRTPPPYRLLTIELERPRAELYARIDQRIDLMIQMGLIKEVFDLIRRGYSWSLPAMSSLGYREFQALWEGRSTAAACITELKFNTHRFARKQGAWFRRLPCYHGLPAAAPDLMRRALSVARSELGLEPAQIDH